MELRNLARGIHPAVLTDRGLDAAVSALAARCPVPVAVDVDLPRRAGARTEAIAYFFVAEALTNVAKHAQASRAWLSAEFQGDRARRRGARQRDRRRRAQRQRSRRPAGTACGPLMVRCMS